MPASFSNLVDMNKLQRYIITAAITAVIIFLIWYFGDIVKYILVSAVLSLMGKPLVDVLCRIHIREWVFPKWLAATITLCTLWGIAILAISLFVPLVVDKINALAEYDFADFTSMFNEPIRNFETFLHDKFSIDLTPDNKYLTVNLHDKLAGMLSPALTGLNSILDSIANFFIAAFSISFITFFFLKENDLFNDGVAILFPSKYEENVRRALKSSIQLLSRYFIGLLVESTIKLIVIACCVYFIVGIPVSDAVIIALISAVLNVIPYIGPLLGGIVGILIGITSPDTLLPMNTVIIEMAIIFTVFQVIDNIILQPYVYSSSVKAHPLEIFLVILVAGSIAGVVGMLLAIPAYTVLRVFAKEFFNKLRVVQKLTGNI